MIVCAEPVGQVTPDSSADDLANLDFSKIHALTGSIAINGAVVFDIILLELLDMQYKGWGWTGHIPHFGLLQEDFDYAYIHHWELDGDACRFGLNGITLSFEAYPRLSRRCARRARIVWIRSGTLAINGGNVDTSRLFYWSSTFWLPFLAEGAL